MPNPLRHEQDTFRMLVSVVVGAGIVIAVTLASEPIYGLVAAATLLGFAIGKLWSDYRHWRSAEHVAGGGPEPPPAETTGQD